MSRDFLKYNPCSSNFQLSSLNSGNRWSSVATRPNDNVRVKETAKRKTVATPRRYTTTETLTRTVDIKPQQKRKSGPCKPPPAKKARTKVSTKSKSGSNRVSSSTRITCSKDYSSDETSTSQDSYSDTSESSSSASYYSDDN